MELGFTVEDIFRVNERNFNELAIEIFQFQYNHNAVYQKFVSILDVDPQSVKHIAQIPFMPVEIFKFNEVITGNWKPDKTKCFKSSATTQVNRSIHYYNDAKWYNKALLKSFELFYGEPNNWHILALLPGYLENPHASLVQMVKVLMGHNGGFFLNDFELLKSTLEERQKNNDKVLLIGVSHALIDFAEKYPKHYGDIAVIETGGMKGRKKEITRLELHSILKTAFGLEKIHSEYGMTELFSQAYSLGHGKFRTPPWMKVLIRQSDNPFDSELVGQAGGINVIDLANIESCCFLATSDIGRTHLDGTFEVLGRFDHSEVRGCNVMIR